MPEIFVRCITISFLFALAQRCESQMLTAQEKASTLQFVNYLRRNMVPKAADMNGLLWDSNLENLAQRAANRCVFEHNYDGEYASLGETLYRGGSRNFSHILMFMVLERENYNYTSRQCTAVKYPFFTTCGHYLQIASASVSRIGCAVQLCNDVYLAACEYNRQYSNPPYQTGEPCTKCGNGYATYCQQDLCYAMLPGDPAPIPGPLDCKLICMNTGNVTTMPFCSCVCPAGFYGVRCEIKNIYYQSTLPNDCLAQAVACKNGGTPTMFDTVCKCVCPNNFRGERCEVNIQQIENSISIYFGGQVIYQSYYPVAVTQWTTSTLRNQVKQALTAGVNNFCLANAAQCCPNSSQAINPFVDAESFRDTDNYPSQDLDGTMIATVYYTLSTQVATQCNNGLAYVAKSILMQAWNSIEISIKQTVVTETGLRVIRVS